ncbi:MULTISPECIES: CCA tRNA nucleotidyltransferase [unclassified Sedimentibacter]|uniref:CCA tRNA nucleotidyltransferase n=1 Tax=unclassified Sedimentibacter TaxID=2649220 RepID=UPI0027DF503F|nr:CCA tRNA nucleotidyltransferase [Sedimentibacter sp. MB35-C1]WMJ77578.1 CCA tRNA nucleotidyltransferase [Sedimentibacter sp. MB35-C1]
MIIKNIPKEVKTALNILNKNGFEAYIVGGCVRDSLLGVVPNDWDITTSARPEEITKCFDGFRTINTGLKHGTVTVIINGRQLEVTTYRIDGEYTDNRRPDSVIFTKDVSCDLKRRDFTINSLAYNKGGIIDLFGGARDIESKIVKCVGDPDERFNEDGLRILRALRFASVLDFNIDARTSSSIHSNRNLLSNISRERISTELNKLITGVNYYDILKEYKDVIEVFIPEIANISEDNWSVILDSMGYGEGVVLRLALMLHETNEAEKILRNLKYDGATIKSIKFIAAHKDEEVVPSKVLIKTMLSKIGYDNFVNLLKFKTAVFKALKRERELENIKSAEKILNEILINKECYNLNMLEINGEDLIREGFTKGVVLGSVLNEILKLVIEEKLENRKEALFDCARKLKNNC